MCTATPFTVWYADDVRSDYEQFDDEASARRHYQEAIDSEAYDKVELFRWTAGMQGRRQTLALWTVEA